MLRGIPAIFFRNPAVGNAGVSLRQLLRDTHADVCTPTLQGNMKSTYGGS